MDCKKHLKGVRIDDRSLKEQEYRRASRLWNRTIQKQSSTTIQAADIKEDDCKKEVRFDENLPCLPLIEHKEFTEEDNTQQFPETFFQRKMTKMKFLPKKKSPLQQFDEIVTREITSRQNMEDESCCMSPFESSQKWSSNLDYCSSKISCSGRKAPFDTKISKTTISNVERELKNRDKDPSDVENAALMDAIEKLIQAQASCRFDAAVRAAEEAASSAPPEMAEEFAINCAKEYQSEIIDIVKEKVAVGGGKNPMEVIGYIGITKRKDLPEDDEC